MACNTCETTFQQNQSLVVSITRSGNTGTLWLQNQGKNIVMIRRIILCYASATGSGVLYLRPPPDSISWSYPSAFLEPGISAPFYSLTITDVRFFQAQAEYIEIDGRSRSCEA